MRHPAIYIISLFIFIGTASVLSACEELLNAGLIDGQAVQLHLEITEKTPNNSVTVNQVAISLAEIKIVSRESEYDFALPDSTLMLFPEDPDRFASEKVIPADMYRNLKVVFGSRPDSSGTDSTAASPVAALTVKGIFKGNPFEFSLPTNLGFGLNLRPPLRVGRNSDSLGVLTMAMDYSSWFLSDDGKTLLDPNVTENSEQIAGNILSSATIRIEKGVDDELGMKPRGNIGLAGDVQGKENDTSLVFAVEMNRAIDDTVTVDFETVARSAKAGEDYFSEAGTLTFLPGERSKTVEVTLIDDTAKEPEESFSIRLKSPVNADIDNRKKSAKGIIQDDDTAGGDTQPAPTVGITGDTSGSEGAGSLTFSVKLSEARDSTVSVAYHTSDNSAKAGKDYETATGTLTFTPGETQKEITISLIDDAVKEADEYFTLTLSDPVNVQIDNSGKTAKATIVDDDAN